MRIVHFINNINLSWYGMFTDTLRAQAARGHEVKVVVPPGGINYKRLAGDGFDAVPLPVRSSKFDYHAAWKLSRFIEKNGADVLHTHLTSSALLGSAAAAWAGVPCVASVLKMTNKRRYMRCDRLLPCSDAVRDDLTAQGVPEGLLRRVYTGINIEEFMAGFTGARAARKEFGFLPEHKVIGVIARLAPMKGHSVLLAAAPGIFAGRPEARLLIVGDGELRPALEKQAADLGVADRVVFAGTRRDLQNILESIDVSVLSSVEKEGLPVILVQSVLAGKPVVMSDVAGIREIIRDGETGRLVAPGDAGALAAAAGAALDDPAGAARMAKAAHGFVAREFDVNYTVEQMDEVYEEVRKDRIKN